MGEVRGVNFCIRIFLLAFFYFLFSNFYPLFSTPAFCAEDEQPIVCNGDKIEYIDDNKRLIGTGNMTLDYENMKLSADKVEVNLQTKEAVATGNVIMKQGADTFYAESVVYNFVDKKGKLLNGSIEAPPWYGRCDEITKLNEKEYVLGNGYISTCGRFPPHYRIRTKQVKLYLDDRIVAKNVVICAGSVPIMYLPVYTHNMKSKKPNISLVPGHSKEWGYYNLAAFRYNLNETDQGKIRFDLRSKKGLASGATYNYELNFLDNNVELGKGIFDIYYTNEDDKTKPKDSRSNKERYRAMLRHKWYMDEGTTALLEYNKLKDPTFTKDYFYRQEYVNETQPKTYVYMLNAQPGYSAGFLFQPQVNNFFSQTEYLPKFDLDIKDQRLFGKLPVYYSGDYSAANLVKKTAYTDVDDDSGRLDGYNEIAGMFTPFKPVVVKPYVATRRSWYSKDINGGSGLARGIFYTGVDTSTKFYKTYNLETKFAGLDIHGLRHVLTPLVRYKYIHKPTVASSRLAAFDDIDTIVAKNAVTLGLNNNFQTKRENGAFDLGRFNLSADYNLQKNPGREFGNIDGELEVIPSGKFLVQSDASFNPHSTKFDIANIDFVAKKDDRTKLGLGQRYQRKDSSQMTMTGDYPLTEKLGLHLYERYEFYGRDIKEQEYGVFYDMHCWLMDVNFNSSQASGNSIWVIFRLKAFPEFPIQLGTTYESPKPETI